MTEWLSYSAAGGLTAFGAALAANVSPGMHNRLLGALVLLLIYGLHWANVELSKVA